MSNRGEAGREVPRRSNGLARRFGGSITGVGIGTGILHLFGSGNAFTASVPVAMLLIGISLLALGYRSRHSSR